MNALFDILLLLARAQRVVVSSGSNVKAGVTSYGRLGETHVYRNSKLEIVGILRVLSSGKFIIAVRDDHRRRGIATALLDAARPDFSKSTYSTEGQFLVDAYKRRKRDSQEKDVFQALAGEK